MALSTSTNETSTTDTPVAEHAIGYSYPSSSSAERLGHPAGCFNVVVGQQTLGFKTFADAVAYVRRGNTKPGRWSMDHPDNFHMLSAAQLAIVKATPASVVGHTTGVALIERCIQLDETETVLDFAEELAELMAHLPDVLKCLTLATQVNAAMESMLLQYGSKLKPADLVSRTENSDALGDLLSKLGACAVRHNVSHSKSISCHTQASSDSCFFRFVKHKVA